MFDIIGFWFAVTCFTFLFLLAVVPLGIVIVDNLINLITQGDHKKFIEHKFGLEDYFDDDENKCFNLWISSGVALLFYALYVFIHWGEGWALHTGVMRMSDKLAPIFSTVFITLFVWLAFLYSGRFIYKMSKAIKKLQEQAGE